MTRPGQGSGASSRASGGRSSRGTSFFSQTVQYAMRVITHLADTPSDEPRPAVELAQQTDIPTHYLAKILRKLVTHGLLTARKGRGGGISLARPAHTVTVADILAAVGESFTDGQCALGKGPCNALDPCVLHAEWSRLTGIFDDWARTATLCAPPEASGRDDADR